MKLQNRWTVLVAIWAAFFVVCTPAGAQWQVPTNAIPLGKGAGTGFASLSCPTLGSFPTYNGSSWVCSTETAPQAAVLNGTLNLNPLAASSQRGLNIATSGPSTGSTAGAIYSNLVQGSWNNTLTGAGSPGTTTCACWSLFQISAATGGSFSGLESYALSVGNVVSANKASTAEVVGVSMGVSTNFTNAGRMYGGSSAATVGASGSAPVLVGFEIGVAQNNSTTSNVPIRYGLNVDNYGSFTASGVDTAISIQGGATGGSWKTGITFTNPGGALAPALTTTGKMMASEVAMTVDTIFDFSNVTASSYVFNTPKAQLTGSGILGLGSLTADGAVSLVGGSGGNMSVTWTHNGTANFTMGAVAATWYLSAVGAGANAIQIAKSTNIVTIPTGLAVQGSFTSSVNLTPASNDGASLGTTALKWSDLFLAAGAVVNFNSGAATVTESSGNLNSVVASGKTFNFQGGDASNPVVQVLSGGGATPASMNFGRVSSEALMGIAAAAGNFWTSAAAGDFTLRSLGGKLILTTGYTNGGVVLDTSDNVAIGASLATKVASTFTGTSGTISSTDATAIFNASGTFTATLPSAATYPGRWLHVKNIAAQTVNSASSNIVPLAGGAAGTALLSNTAGKWAILKSNGTAWEIIAAN